MRRLPIALTAAAILAAFASTAPASAALPAGTELTKRGLGPIRLGMTLREIERASGLDLTRDRFPGSPCSTAGFGHRNYLLFRRDKLARITVHSRRFSTASGIRVGDRRREVLRRYGAKVRRSPHTYTRGEYLDIGRRSPRLMFETSGGGRIVDMHAGIEPEIGYVEACA